MVVDPLLANSATRHIPKHLHVWKTIDASIIALLKALNQQPGAVGLPPKGRWSSVAVGVDAQADFSALQTGQTQVLGKASNARPPPSQVGSYTCAHHSQLKLAGGAGGSGWA